MSNSPRRWRPRGQMEQPGGNEERSPQHDASKYKQSDSPRRSGSGTVKTDDSPEKYASRLKQSRVPVSDMVKMFTPPNSAQFGNRTTPGITARKWPPVDTTGSQASNKPPPPMAPKPAGYTPHRPPTAAKPFQSDNKSNVPKWQQDRQARTAGNATSDRQDNLPPWKQRQLLKQQEEASNDGNRRPSWSRNEPDQSKDSTPTWKRQQQLQNEERSEDRRPSWAKTNGEPQAAEDSNIPQWKRDLNRAKGKEKAKENEPSWRSNEPPKPLNSWSKPKPNDSSSAPSSGPRWGPKPPPKPDVDSKPHATVPWSERNKENNDLPSQPSAFLKPSDTGAPKRFSPQSKSFTGYQSTPKPDIEKSSGSFGSGSSPKMPRKFSEPPAPPPTANANTSPQKRVSSFLHTGPKSPSKTSQTSNAFPPPPSPMYKPQKTNGVPKRLPIPEEKYYEPPPLKTSKPPDVVLPNKGKKKLSLPSLPTSLFSRSSSSSRDQPEPPPPVGSRDLPVPPPLGPRDLPAIPPAGGQLPPPLPPMGARDLPPPPGPRDGHAPNLPPLPSRPELPPPDLPARPLPSPTPGPPFGGPPPIEEDIYDDAADDPPPPPRPAALVKQPSSGLIPTWDEEDEVDNIYDETPDEPPPRPQVPAGFPTPGGPAAPIPEDEGEDMYEDVEEYMRLKKLQQQQPKPSNGSVPDGKEKKEKEKKKKESEKRERDTRKKFKLPAEGEIAPEGRGIVKENCKRNSKNLGVTKDERIEIVRMTNNPKGKWLIRNAQGEYGYVESDKVTIDLDQLRHTFGVGNKAPSGIGGGPPVAIIPTADSDDEAEAVYDETADEDIYEEV